MSEEFEPGLIGSVIFTWLVLNVALYFIGAFLVWQWNWFSLLPGWLFRTLEIGLFGLAFYLAPEKD